MTGAKRIGVLVSPHARQRFAERFPAEAAKRDPTAAIYAEVQDALRDGRRAVRKPAWSSWSSREKNSYGGRFVWNLDRTRAYAVVRVGKSQLQQLSAPRSSVPFDETWIVKTVLPRNHEDEVDRGHALRYMAESRKGRQRRRGRLSKGKRDD